MKPTPLDIANTIRMLPKTKHGTVLLVEGRNDVKFFSKFIDHSACLVYPASGKENARGALKILEKAGLEQVIAVIDCDHDSIFHYPKISHNCVYIPSNDLESMLLRSPAYRAIIDEFIGEEKYKLLCQTLKGEVLDYILSCCVEIGYLRLVSKSKELNLTFEGIKYSSFFDQKSLTFDYQSLIMAIKNKSQRPSLNIEELTSTISTLKKEIVSPWEIVCGHDLTEMIAIAFRNGNRAISASEIEQGLRLGFSKSDFMKTSLYEEIKNWEREKSGRKVLAF